MKETFLNTIRFISSSSVNILLLIIGIADTYLSWLYSYEWLYYIGTPTFIGGLFAFITVIFAVIVFEVGVVLIRNKGKKIHIAILFFVWLVLALYSIQSTVASQYITFIDAEFSRQKDIAEDINKRSQIEQYDQRIADYKERITTLQERIESYSEVLKDIEDIKELGTWRTTVKDNEERIRELEEDIRNYEQQIKETEQKKDALLEDAILEETSIERNVFQFYEDIIKTDADEIQFILAVFRAVMLDIINVMCFLFLTVGIITFKDISGTPVQSEKSEKTEQEEDQPEEEQKVKRKSLPFRDAVIFFTKENFRQLSDERDGRRLLGVRKLKEKAPIAMKYYNKITKILLENDLIFKRGTFFYVRDGVTEQDFYSAIFRRR